MIKVKHRFYKCVQCGREINNPNNQKKYCSDKCRKEVLRKQRLKCVKNWQKRNKEKLKQYKRKYYQENCIEINNKCKERYERNKLKNEF